MHFGELKKSVSEEIKQIYYIEGEDAFLRENALKTIFSAALSEPDFNLNCFVGQEMKNNPEAVLTAVRSYPFMSDKRVVVIREYYPSAQDLKNKTVKEILSGTEETTVLVIVNSEKSEAIKKQDMITLVDCSKLDRETIAKYIRRECSAFGIVAEREAIDMLTDYASSDMTKISGEVKKLTAYIGDNGELTVEAVEDVCVKDTEYQVYELAEYIAAKNDKKAFETLTDMLDKNTDKQRLFISVYYHFRRLLHSAVSACSDKELAAALGVKEYAVKKSRVQAKKFTPKRLKKICDKLSYLDSAFKSGEVTVDSALWNSVFNAITG